MSQLVSKVLSTSTMKIALIGTFATVIALGVCGTIIEVNAPQPSHTVQVNWIIIKGGWYPLFL